MPLNEVYSFILDSETKSNGGYVTLFIVVMCFVLAASWLLYAYYNPHTPSGQLLIKVIPFFGSQNYLPFCCFVFIIIVHIPDIYIYIYAVYFHSINTHSQNCVFMVEFMIATAYHQNMGCIPVETVDAGVP